MLVSNKPWMKVTRNVPQDAPVGESCDNLNMEKTSGSGIENTPWSNIQDGASDVGNHTAMS
jgi:hypothetical protein